MHGFSNKYKSFPEYIIGITKEIWEERGISTLHELSLIHISEPTRPY